MIGPIDQPAAESTQTSNDSRDKARTSSGRATTKPSPPIDDNNASVVKEIDPALPAFIGIQLNPDTHHSAFRHVTCGKGMVLDPAGANKKEKPSKFVVIISSQDIVKEFVKKAVSCTLRSFCVKYF